MKNLKLLVMLLSLFLFMLSVKIQAQDLRFEAEDLTLVKKMYAEGMPFWNVYGTGDSSIIYASPEWSRMLLSYTLQAKPATVYDVIFFSSNNDPGAGNLDISWDSGVTWDNSYRSVAGEKKVNGKVTTDKSGIISFLTANPKGLAACLDYIRLVDISVRQESLVSFVSGSHRPSAQEILAWLTEHPNSLQVLWRPKRTSDWVGQTASWKVRMNEQVLTGEVRDDSQFSVSVEGKDIEEAVRLTVTLTANQEAGEAYELVLAAPFQPGQWQRQFYPQLPYRILKPEERTSFRFLANAEDKSLEEGLISFYPFGVLENKNGFLFWGAMDIGKFRVLTPNAVPAAIPCFTYTPVSIRKGQVFTFDLTMNWLPKPQFRYRDVLRWYLQAMENSDLLTKDWVKRWDGKFHARPLSEGNLIDTIGSLGQKPDPDREEYSTRWSKDVLHMGSLWFGIGANCWTLGPLGETHHAEESWKTVGKYGELEVSAEQVRDEIHRLKTNGFHPLMYFCQLYPLERLYGDRPPFNNWIGYNKEGKLMLYDAKNTVMDFGNDDFRNWYISRVKACMDFYNPVGIAWDMGFGSVPMWNYSRANPNSSIPHGILRVQAELWKYLHEKYPEMRIITNEAVCSLSQIFSDGVILENAHGGGKGELDYEAAKALGTTIIAYEYPRVPEFLFHGVPTSDYRYLAMYYRAEGLDAQSQEPVVSAGLSWDPSAGPVIKHSDLQTDGQWHTIVVDLKQKLPNLTAVNGLTITVISAERGNGHLWIEFIRLSQNPDGTKTQDLPVKDSVPIYWLQFPVTLDARHFDFWVPNPIGIWPPEVVATNFNARIEGGITEFFVQDVNRKMKWFTQPPVMTATLMRVMSYGGCLGSGAITEYLPEMTKFSAKAMYLPLLVGSHEVEVKTTQGAMDDGAVTASAWAGNGQLMLVAYNNGKDKSQPRIVIAPEALHKAGIQQISPSVIHVLGRNGRPLSGRSADVSLEKKTGLYVQVQLGTGEALLFQMSDNKNDKGGD